MIIALSWPYPAGSGSVNMRSSECTIGTSSQKRCELCLTNHRRHIGTDLTVAAKFEEA